MSDEQEKTEAPPETRPANQALFGERNYQRYPSGSAFTERILIAGDWPLGKNGHPIPKLFFKLTVATGVKNKTDGTEIHLQEIVQSQAGNAGDAAIRMPDIIDGARNAMLKDLRQKMLAPKLALPPPMFNHPKGNHLRG